MYHFMHDMNDMLHTWTKLNHISLFMNASSSLLKIQICVVIKLDFGLEKWDMFLCVEKIVFGIEKSNMCLLNKTKSFGFKKYQICFLELKKLVFWWKKNQIYLMIIKNKNKNQICILKKKLDLFLYVWRKIKIKIKDFLRRWLYSWIKSMLHALNETNTTIHDPFFISKSAMLKHQIYV